MIGDDIHSLFIVEMIVQEKGFADKSKVLSLRFIYHSEFFLEKLTSIPSTSFSLGALNVAADRIESYLLLNESSIEIPHFSISFRLYLHLPSDSLSNSTSASQYLWEFRVILSRVELPFTQICRLFYCRQDMSRIKRLIILDLNGLLIHRLYKSEYLKCKRLLQDHYRQNHLTEAVPKGNFAVWFRPNVKEFILWLMDHFHVAIWSSVLQHNIQPIVEHLFPDEAERDRLLFWWNQEQCYVEDDPTATDPKKAKSFFKRLSSVWDSVDTTERWLVNQPNNAELRDHTLLIDDNKAKARDNPPFTAIHPRAWKLFELFDDNQQIRIFNDDTLEKNGALRKWLEGLLEWEGTVAAYVEQHPYVDPPLEEKKIQSDSDWTSGWD